MNHVLMYVAEGQTFDISRVEEALCSLPGIKEVRRAPGPETIIEVDYQDEDGSTIIRLNREADTIAASWHCRSALRAALLLQQELGSPIRIVDMHLDFNLVLEDYATVDQLEEAIRVARGN